jgi:hypothetical protein
MSTTTQAPATASKEVAAKAKLERECVEAMRTAQSESDLWALSDLLVRLVPSGQTGFKNLIDLAIGEGIGAFTEKTLYSYRDSANFWPADKRVAGVSFSAHRSAEPYKTPKNVDASKGLLEKMTGATNGKVTVSAVRRAVAAAKPGGAPPAKKPATTQAATPSVNDALADLQSGGRKLKLAVGNLDLEHLEQVQHGLNNVLTRVEELRARLERQAKANAKGSPAQETQKIAAKVQATVKDGKRQVGDLRDL